MIDRGRVLVVDDDRDFAEALRTLLVDAGYDVVVAHNGREAVAQARRVRPDAILMDVMMDERTEGLFTVQTLRRLPETAATPILVISAVYTTVPTFQIPPDPQWSGHDVFLPKPIDPEHLLARLGEVLARKGTMGPASQE